MLTTALFPLCVFAVIVAMPDFTPLTMPEEVTVIIARPSDGFIGGVGRRHGCR